MRLHWSRRKRASKFQCAVFEFFGLDDLIGETYAKRLICADLTSAENEIFGPRWADQSRQTLRSATTGDDAEKNFRLPKFCAGRTHSQIASQRQFTSSTKCWPSDSRNHDARNCCDGIECIEEKPSDHASFFWACEFRNVRASGEDSVGPENDNRAGRVSGERFRRSTKLAQDLRRQRIDLAVLETEHGNAVFPPLDSNQCL
jgi:hypothetical protein